MRIAFDPDSGPGCVLVAAAMGCDTAWLHRVDTRLWVTAPTPGMRAYEATPEQVDALVARLEGGDATPVSGTP